MEINLTERQSIGTSVFVNHLSDPFYKQVHKIKQKALDQAAKKFVRCHRWILTLQTLPDDIYDSLPKSEYLQVGTTTTNRWGAYALSSPEVGVFPTLKNMIGERYNYNSNGPDPQKIVECDEDALTLWQSADPLLDRGNDLSKLLHEYLEEADFQTVEQIMWSAPQVVDAFWDILRKESPRFRSKNHTPQDIFLDRVRRRRENPSDRRRPQKIHAKPSQNLQALIGEAKLLHSAQKK